MPRPSRDDELVFQIVHAHDVRPARRGIWFVHEHSARSCADAMTPVRWRADGRKRPAREVTQWQSGPRWGVVAVRIKKSSPRQLVSQTQES